MIHPWVDVWEVDCGAAAVETAVRRQRAEMLAAEPRQLAGPNARDAHQVAVTTGGAALIHERCQYRCRVRGKGQSPESKCQQFVYVEIHGGTSDGPVLAPDHKNVPKKNEAMLSTEVVWAIQSTPGNRNRW